MSNLATAWAAIEAAIEALDPETLLSDGSGKAYAFIDSADEEYGGGGHRSLIWSEDVRTDDFRDTATGQTGWQTTLRMFWHRDRQVGTKVSTAAFRVASQNELELLRKTIDGLALGGVVQAIILRSSSLSITASSDETTRRGTGRIPTGDVYEGRIDLTVDVIEET